MAHVLPTNTTKNMSIRMGHDGRATNDRFLQGIETILRTWDIDLSTLTILPDTVTASTEDDSTYQLYRVSFRALDAAVVIK